MNTKEKIGIVFDLDGVISDTAKLHFKAWKQEAEKIGMSLTREQNDKLRGLNRQKTAKAICDLNDVKLSEDVFNKFCEVKNNVYKEFLRTQLDKSFILGNMDKTLPLLREAGYALGVASSSHNAPTILKNLDLEKYFDGVVDPATIVHHKPFPEMYEKGAKFIGTKCENTIGVEDAPAGAKGILAAGMVCVAVKWTTPTEQFEGSHYIVNDSKELTKEFFDKVVREKITNGK